MSFHDAYSQQSSCFLSVSSVQCAQTHFFDPPENLEIESVISVVRMMRMSPSPSSKATTRTMGLVGLVIVAQCVVFSTAATLNVDVQTSTVQNALIHAGNDYTNQQYVATGSTVNFGSVDGDLWVNNYQQLSVLDASSVTTVESPSPCAESSAMQTKVNGTTTLFLFHGPTMQCSCAWSPDAPCPAKLRVEKADSGVPPIEYFISVRSVWYTRSTSLSPYVSLSVPPVMSFHHHESDEDCFVCMIDMRVLRITRLFGCWVWIPQ